MCTSVGRRIRPSTLPLSRLLTLLLLLLLLRNRGHSLLVVKALPPVVWLVRPFLAVLLLRVERVVVGLEVVVVVVVVERVVPVGHST